MTIGEILKHNDINTYNKLMKAHRTKRDKPKKKIELGDLAANLMKTDSYTRSGRRMKQRSWG